MIPAPTGPALASKHITGLGTCSVTSWLADCPPGATGCGTGGTREVNKLVRDATDRGADRDSAAAGGEAKALF